MAPIVPSEQSSPDDEQPIRAVVDRLLEAWNRHDMKAFADAFSGEAEFATIGGTRLTGRDQIEKHHAEIHASHYRDSVLTAFDVSVRYLRPDVRIAHMPNEVVFDGGRQRVRTLMLLVLVRSGERWEIVAAHNTLAGPPPAALIERWRAATAECS